MTDETALFNSHALFGVLSMHRSGVAKIDTINVKAQGLQTKTSYKGLIQSLHACIILTDSYYFLNHTAMHHSLLKYQVATLALLDCTLLHSTMYLFGSTLLHSFMCLFGSTLLHSTMAVLVTT